MAVSAKNFKFVSPQIHIEEIDKSQIPAAIPAVGPVIIGRAARGPAFTPVRVESFSEFVQTFGNPVPGGAGGDVWREGNRTSPMYGTYGMQSWLKNGETATYIRLLGVESVNKTSTGDAGWKVGDAYDGTAVGGAYALIVAPSGSGTHAQAIITFTGGAIPYGTLFTITDGQGRSVAYTARATEDLTATPPEFTGDGGSYTVTEMADSLRDCILSANGHGYDSSTGRLASITVPTAAAAGAITVTQVTRGIAGNTAAAASGNLSVTGVSPTTADTFTGGADTGTSNATGSVAAIWYLEAGNLDLVGNDLESGTSVAKTSTLIGGAAGSAASAPEFTVRFSGTSLPSADFTFSFNKGKANYIRKVFNTDPTLLGRLSDKGEVKYFLGETYENTFLDQLGSGSSTYTGGDFAGAIVGLASGSTIYQNNFLGQGALESSTYAKSGWFLSQDMSSDTSTFTTVTAAITADRIKKLFRFVGLDAGEWTQNNLKISLTNIRPSINENVYAYGSFTVLVRQLRDDDTAPRIVERFEGCNLDPNSDNYLLRKVGTKYVAYDENAGRVYEVGEFDNRSKYIRVEISSEFVNGFDSSYIPYGVTGPTKWVDVVYTSGQPSSGNPYILAGSSLISADVGAANVLSGSNIYDTLRFNFPAVPTRTTTSTLDTRKQAYWGAQTTADGTDNFKEDVRDLVRIKPANTSNQYTADGNVLKYQYAISLDNVAINGASALDSPTTLAQSASVLVYDTSSRSGGYSLSTTASVPSNVNGGTADGYKTLLNMGCGNLTTLFFGGTDGWDITTSDPLAAHTLDGDSLTKENSYEYMTYRRALDIAKEPEIIAYNLISAPGLVNQSLTNTMINNTSERADAMAVIDIPESYDVPADYLYDSGYTEGDYGNVLTAVTTMKSRAYNSSYGATYYPWVKVRDAVNSTDLWVPPSVAGLGAMAYTDRVQAPWFAPAGFNRGGLSSGVAGLPVVAAALKLFKDDRDDLYEVNINPIASFPNEGIVMFGQKTLQVQRSALDRINVRRLLIYLKRGISRIASQVLFEPNVPNTWDKFKSQAIPFLDNVKSRFGLTDYKLVLDESTTTPDLIDQNIMYAKLFLKPARAIEFIALDFIITNTGASFDD